ncbi:MAG: sugar phosphate isomerase/epimerase [Verrucomicrobia bacterium]|nr:sugar phosphate isomerase/epimerase [Verrucomicrobiota bacterium]
MKNSTPLTRRDFLATTAATGAALALSSPLVSLGAEKKKSEKKTAAAAPPKKNYKIIAFSKPFSDLSPEQTADLVADVGWDGIECPVRAKATHIEPEQVEEGLPKMVEALKKRGKEVVIVTSDITKLNPIGEKVLRTMAKLGIRKYRLGFEKYPKDVHPSKVVAEVGAALKDIAALNKELGLQAGWQNHSGSDYVGAPLWDLWTMMKDLDPKHMGVCYDIGHSTLEGGLSWPVQARLMQERFVAVFCKDFYWEKTDKGWAPRWCNFGAGSVHKEFFDWLRTTNFAGPLSQHHEYKELGKGPEMIANMKQDLAKLREWLA